MAACRYGVGLVLSAALVIPTSATAQTPHVYRQSPTAVPSESADSGASEQSPLVATAPVRPFTPSFGSLFSGLGTDFRQLTTNNAFLIMGIGGGAALGAHAFDRSMALSASGSSASTSRMFGPGQLVGSMFVQSGAAFATYVAGRAAGSPRLAQVGAELVRAQFVAQGVTQTIKFGSHRTRPDGTPFSFPSGHTASSFATATVLQREFGWKVGIPAYVGAAWVGASRINSQRHFLSDVVAGATVGILAGHAVTVGSGGTRFSLGPMAVPGGIGIGVVRLKK
jgi:membrane-associated phospholipid phosphatase